MYQIDINNPVHIHFIGIGGISMSGLAGLLVSRGFTVSGSDRADSEILDGLRDQGVRIFIGQAFHLRVRVSKSLGITSRCTGSRRGSGCRILSRFGNGILLAGRTQTCLGAFGGKAGGEEGLDFVKKF